jgi:hypothetical protein
MRQVISFAWNFIFNADVSPLRHIQDVSMRHYILQALGFMWAIGSVAAVGSYTLVAASVVGHSILIGCAAITMATYTAATVKPTLFVADTGRRLHGEHK